MADAAAAKDAADRDAAELWAFSLEFYARPGIAETCLRLQDAHGLDVNLLLLCCWLGSSGRGRLSEADLAAAEARAAQWRQAVIVPLRAIRRALKPMNAALYEAVKRVELDAEREEQSLLLARGLGAPQTPSDRVGDATANLTLYLSAHGLPAETGRELVCNL